MQNRVLTQIPRTTKLLGAGRKNLSYLAPSTLGHGTPKLRLASLRHGVGLLAVRHLSAGWPHGTFAVNLLGSLLMGLLVGWLALKAEGVVRGGPLQRRERR